MTTGVGLNRFWGQSISPMSLSEERLGLAEMRDLFFLRIVPPTPISIHAPRVGSDHRHGKAFYRAYRFQSTLPVWGATFCPYRKRAGLSISIYAPRGGSDSLPGTTPRISSDFNPRSPWGERPSASREHSAPIFISIHAPRGGSDPLPAPERREPPISIHAPRGGSDYVSSSSSFLE